VVLGHIKPRALAKQQDAQEEKRPLVQRTKPVSLKVAAWLTGVSLLGFGIYKLIQLSKHKAPVKSAVNSSNKSEAFQAQRHNQ
jgi:hypothetical protein